MKRIRFLILLFAAMFCSNVLYAQTYVINSDSTKVAFTIGKSNEFYLGDARVENVYLGRFEGDEIKIPLFKNAVLSYRNNKLYIDDNITPLLKIVDDKIYLTNDGQTYTYAFKKVNNKVFSSEGKLVWLYSGHVPDKFHALIAFIVVGLAISL